MQKKLFLLDGMALVYRAHFALAARPIFTSKGVNTSALYGFTQTLLEIINTHSPTHLAVAFDTDAPTYRHKEFKDYKATRQAMPEDLSKALPHVRRMLEAFRIPILTCDGYEADDLIGTLVRRAEQNGFTCYIVSPDKDFGQLISEKVLWYKPGRMGDPPQTFGIPEIQARWGIQSPAQVVDILALMGDTSDNIPGVPGIGEKTAMKLVGDYGTLEKLLDHVDELPGRAKTALEANREQALASRRLATILCDAPCPIDLESLKLMHRDDEKLKALLVEFEFNTIGKRLFGESFRAGRGYAGPTESPHESKATDVAASSPTGEPPLADAVKLKTLADTPHEYATADSASTHRELLQLLSHRNAFAFATSAVATGGNDEGSLAALAFAVAPGKAYYLPLGTGNSATEILAEFLPVFARKDVELTGHNLKADLRLLMTRGVEVRSKLFDVGIAHALLEPDMRHSLQYLAESFLGCTPRASSQAQAELNLGTGPSEPITDALCEKADLALQLRTQLEPQLKEKKQERVFYEIESPLSAVLAGMEHEGISVNATALEEFATQLGKEIDLLEKRICQLAGTAFNVNSPRQLGQILFEVMKICEAPKKTRTGQYATDEQTLMALAPDHEIVRLLLDHRASVKLKSTYADALPSFISPVTGRIHTTYNQVSTSTGRLNSQNPNVQNIPIRRERGQEIRKAFIPRGPGYELLSADYSQIELRIIAALSKETGLIEAFRSGVDVHTATAARVFGVPLESVTSEMRRKAKMVNYGIAYGISAFGLAQRLAIQRREATEIIQHYFTQFPGIRGYMERTVAFARQHGYVETITGRRRYIRDITSSNNTVRSAAERNAINAPIQGSAADMIKLAMIHIDAELKRGAFQSRMLLQVHDELVFDLHTTEAGQVMPMIREKMEKAIPLDVPLEVEMGVGANWLEAH
jgi:DNA polymerase-1